MTNYRAILNFHHLGNTTTQVATICECSRTTVLKTIKRAEELNLQLPIPRIMSDTELFAMFCPRMGRDEGYYVPDFTALDKDKIKRSFTKERAWEKYCRVAKRMGLKAYSRPQFFRLYHDHFNNLYSGPRPNKHANVDQIAAYGYAGRRIASTLGKDSINFAVFQLEVEGWCSKLRLEPHKILPDLF